ncbi:MAG: glycosyltransferase family 2 protein [Candidatus Nealsonbacteria bacterium]|nr:MAG: glycosyltransferase family 2 protein [Candidatus Nealsonbacteria bacterium]
MYLSVIIPAYNEERRIPKTLEEIDKYLRKQDYDYEILVVDDGSKDRTVEVTKGLISKIKNLIVTGYKKNRGKGYAVRFGMLEAKGDYRLFTDADNSTSIDHVEKIWPEFKKGFDIIIGSRDIKGAVLDPPQPWIRKLILGEGFKLYRKIIIGLWGIEDTQCGFKCFTKKATEKIFQKCRINRFAFDPEFLVIAKKLGYEIKEIPIYWKNDPESKVKFKSIIKMALDLIKIRLNLIKRVYD